MEQIGFMNQDISIFDETELTDTDFLNAVELLSYPAAASHADPQTTTTTSNSPCSFGCFFYNSNRIVTQKEQEMSQTRDECPQRNLRKDSCNIAQKN